MAKNLRQIFNFFLAVFKVKGDAKHCLRNQVQRYKNDFTGRLATTKLLVIKKTELIFKLTLIKKIMVGLHFGLTKKVDRIVFKIFLNMEKYIRIMFCILIWMIQNI